MTPKEIVEKFGPREAMAYDVVVVGAGPAGLATAIRLKELNADLSVIVLEKGSEPGAHILSWAVMDPRALTELFPDWKERGAPLNQPVMSDDVLLLTATGSRRVPDFLVPRTFHNHGCYVVRLGYVVKWLAE
ncbi:FAD-dependent oxidoreductase, partial [Roseiarcus sp.]|uniref:NAD(P)/FAD-dependent oxidoreductase n=1 Tax=Roseiarcus sp. TaxID=1969460 RepID=UPI003F99DC1C